MSKIVNIYSKRKKMERGEYPDVYQYLNFPYELRVQIIQIIDEAFGYDTNVKYASESYKYVKKALCREYGVFELATNYGKLDDKRHIFEYLLQENNIDKALDVVEICFSLINTKMREGDYSYRTRVELSPSDAINELNIRCKEHGFGFKFESGIIMKIDSEYLHNEVVKQVLSLLSSKDFAGANQEFIQAHEHYRNGKNKECLNECLKSFESTMKSICMRKKIEIDSTETAKKLINILFEKEIIPAFLKSEYSSFQSVLESGIPTIRNRLSAHGQGDTIRPVEDVFAEYMLNLTATNIVFLVKCL